MIDNKITSKDTLAALTETTFLSKLTEKNQRVAIDTLRDVRTREQEGGMLGKLFGTNKTNVSIYVAAILCILLLIVGVCVGDKEIWDKIFTILAAVFGYIFGITQKDN